MPYQKTSKEDCYHDFDIDPACEICGMHASEQYNELSAENKALKKRIQNNIYMMLASAGMHIIAGLFILYIFLVAPTK